MQTNIKVLVVDDDATTRRIEKRLLKQLGFADVEEAADGAEAMKILEVTDVRLILSDWDMPNMTGMEFLQAVRGSDRFNATPFIMVTAKDSKEDIIAAAKARVSQYIVKPFTAQALGEKIKKVLPA